VAQTQYHKKTKQNKTKNSTCLLGSMRPRVHSPVPHPSPHKKPTDKSVDRWAKDIH
jgi:hypothetical protein